MIPVYIILALVLDALIYATINCFSPGLPRLAAKSELPVRSTYPAFATSRILPLTRSASVANRFARWMSDRFDEYIASPRASWRSYNALAQAPNYTLSIVPTVWAISSLCTRASQSPTHRGWGWLCVARALRPNTSASTC